MPMRRYADGAPPTPLNNLCRLILQVLSRTYTYCRYYQQLQHAQNLRSTQAATLAAIPTCGAGTVAVHPARAGGAGAGAADGWTQACQLPSTGGADCGALSDYDPDEDGGDDGVLDPGLISANSGPYYAGPAKPTIAAPAPVAAAPPIATPIMPPPLVLMPSESAF